MSRCRPRRRRRRPGGLFLQRFDELHGTALAVFLGLERRAVALVLQHRQGVHRDIGARGGVGGGRQVVRVGFAGYLEDRDGQALRHFRTAGEPFGIGPALQHRLGVGVALVRLLLDVVEGVEHQQGLLQRVCGDGADLGVVQQLHQRADVVAAEHRAQQFGRLGAVDQGTRFGAEGHGGQVRGLDLGGVVHAGGHAVGQQLQQILRLAIRRVFSSSIRSAVCCADSGSGGMPRAARSATC